VGSGTTFKVYLPCAADEHTKPAAAAVVSGMPRGTESVIVVEDNAAVRTIVCDVLQRLGYRVFAMSNGQQAVSFGSRSPEFIDLLLTDVIMEGMNGRKVADVFREVRPETKVLFMSGYTDDAIVRHGVLEASVQYLGKPFTAEQLAAKVREVLDSHDGEPAT
jgi:CheY-like chemotaxis protein